MERSNSRINVKALVFLLTAAYTVSYITRINFGAVISEMESATLFIVSAIRNLRSGAVFHCVWNQEQVGCGMPVERNEDTSRAIITAVEAMRSIILQDKKL